jgi:hypothetical protein
MKTTMEKIVTNTGKTFRSAHYKEVMALLWVMRCPEGLFRHG